MHWHQQKSHLTTCTLFELSGNPAAGSITNRCTIDQPLPAMLYLLYGTCYDHPEASLHWNLFVAVRTLALLVMSIHSTIVAYKNIKNASRSPPSPQIVMSCLLLLLCPITAPKAIQNIACTFTVRTISWLVR